MIKNPLKRRKLRIRRKIKGSPQRPRLTIYKSLKSLYAQIVDDYKGITLASASVMKKKNKQAAMTLAQSLAQSLKEKKLSKIAFDKNGYAYHGVVKTFADSLRQNGVQF